MSIREFLLENFAGDLEYHPRRVAIYLGLTIAAFCYWIFSPSDTEFTTVHLVFVLGSFSLLGKGIFLLRKSSEGIGLSYSELATLSETAKRKTLPSLPNQVAQIVQDFGVGSLLLRAQRRKDFNHSWNNPPRLPVFLTGATLFALGWLIRRLTAISPTNS